MEPSNEVKVKRSKLEDDAAFMDKYSRQIGAFGLEAMSKLLNLKVLIVGLRGLGMETAKNLVLAGPGAVTLVDDEPTALPDLGANFFLEEKDVGKGRASCVAGKLQELNSSVSVKVHQGPLTESLVASHGAVVFCGQAPGQTVKWDSFCHENGVLFVSCGTMGVYGYVFSDFGKAFTVRDLNGEAPLSRIVTHVSNEEEAVVTLLGAFQEEMGRTHGMDENEHDGWVELSDVEGMEAKEGGGKTINDLGPVKIKTCQKKVRVMVEVDGKKVPKEKTMFDPYRLRISADTRGYTEYLNGGMVTQVKKPLTKAYLPLETCLRQPVAKGEAMLMFTDGMKFARAEQLHLALLGLWGFWERAGRLPQAGNLEEAQEVVHLTEKINTMHANLNKEKEGSALTLDELDKEVVHKVALYSSVEVQPLAAYFGGVVAQEVVKATGKFTPLNQWLHLDFLEMLPERPPLDAAPEGGRYDHLLAVFGKEFVQDKIMNGKTFMVGCGALGCEFLKNFALNGVACGESGMVTVTDNDRIEVSNLNRQFLFRQHNVGQPKSRAAAAAVMAMNPDMKMDTREELVSLETENIFPDTFWQDLDFVTNALDNVKARLYVDSRCVFYGKPLLESGTLGTKCNVQVVVPHVTASYADGPKDQADEVIPMCTLRNFPSLIEHCIEWARAQFEDMFVTPFVEAKKFVENKEGYLAKVRKATVDNPNRTMAMSGAVKAVEDLSNLQRALSFGYACTFKTCIEESVAWFHKLFRDRILQLTHSIPEDHINSAGERFWTGAKRFPQAATLDCGCNEQHLLFVMAAANILAAASGVVLPPEVELLPLDHPQRSTDAIKLACSLLDVPMWEPTSEKIDPAEGGERSEEDGTVNFGEGDQLEFWDSVMANLAGLIDQLAAIEVEGLRFEPANFEKDQDLNFHIDFVSAASNMRAWNYRIKEASRHKCKMIAGKIIPAVATTTASVCGLVMIELFKVLQGKKLEAYKDSSNNLGLNSYFFSEPAPPEKAKDEYDYITMSEVVCSPPGFTKWDQVVVDKGDLTVREFLLAFKEITGLNCTLLFHGVTGIEGPHHGLVLYSSQPHTENVKAIYEANMDTNLKEWVKTRYKDYPYGDVIAPGRKYVELQVSCVNDEGTEYRVPTIVYHWTH